MARIHHIYTNDSTGQTSVDLARVVAIEVTRLRSETGRMRRCITIHLSTGRTIIEPEVDQADATRLARAFRRRVLDDVAAEA